MRTLKKTIILNNNTIKNFNGMAVLTLNQEQNYVYATFKTFNLNIKNNLVLALAQNKKQITKQKINLINNNTYNFKINNLNLDLPISCVLVSDEQTEVVPIVWASDVNNLNTEIMHTFEELKKEPISTEQVKHDEQPVNKNEKLDLSEMFDLTKEESAIVNETSSQKTEKMDCNEMFDLSNEEEIENLITEELNNNIDDGFVLNNKNTELESLETEPLNPIDEELKNLNLGEQTFYESMAEQIDDLFNTYPSESHLEELVPNSKWVKIDYENNGNYYVLGLIYEDIELKYIAYGVPGKYSETAPNGLNNYSQWLPINPQNANEDGYWVMYQNAESGESVEIDAI